MADIYDSQYLLILAPSLVIALMFLFFWLFMKETSYDEVLAKQKRDLKLPPTKPDTRKKSEKKKSKKKEAANVSGGGGTAGESEEEQREYESTNGNNSSSLELDEEPVAEVTLTSAPPVPATYEVPPPPPAAVEPPAGLRERKKKEKKAAKAAAAVVAVAAAPTAAAPPPEEPKVNGSKVVNNKTVEPNGSKVVGQKSVEPNGSKMVGHKTAESNGAKMVGQKTVEPKAQTKQSSPPSPKAEVQVQGSSPVPQVQTPPPSGKKEKKKKQKADAAEDPQPEVKADSTPPPVKKEAPIVAETKVVDGTTPAAPTGKKKNNKKQKTEEANVVIEPTPSVNHQTPPSPPPNDVAPAKPSAKKQKNEAKKENSGLKLKELLSGLSGLPLSDAEAVRVIALLREKKPGALDAWKTSTTKPDPAAQERERLLTTLQEEASIAKDKVKQLSQELQVEKQKTGRAESMMREQRSALEKELGGMQAKAQGSYQELQSMQIKFQKVREQLESQINRLQQENGILRDAVSAATTQMESKNSAELNKLRSEYAGLMKELSDNNSKLQQEEHQRKSLEVGYKQNVSQLEAKLQDTQRRWEELQNYCHSVNTEREKMKASKQELHNQLMAMETEMNNKNKELQTLHNNLAENKVAKERLEQRVMELLEVSQHSMPDDSLHTRAQELMNENKNLQVQKETLQAQNENLQAQLSSQATRVSHIEELQKLLADKELQRKSLEDSLNAERSSGASRETNMQALHNENMSLKMDIQNLQAQMSEQKASQLALDQIQKSVQEREENMKTVEGLLEKGLIEVANKEEELKTVRDENEVLKQQVETLSRRAAEQVTSETVVAELQSKFQESEMKLKSMEESLQVAQESTSVKEKAAELVQKQLATLQAEMESLRQKEATQEQIVSAAELQELQDQLAAKNQQIQVLQEQHEAKTAELNQKLEQVEQQAHKAQQSPELLATLLEKEKLVSDLQSDLDGLRDSLELQRKKNNELRQKNWIAMEALSTTESMLQGKLSKAVKENQSAVASSEAECRDVLHRLLPHVPVPSEQNHQQWLQCFERAAAESPAAQTAPASGDSEELAEKLREAEETQRILQKDCETYKRVLGETEGILQRLQSSVEQEESRWRAKVESSQGELREMSQKVLALEQEVERLTEGADLENLRREKQHLECELERAERESATYVTEVRELKDLLTELRTRLDGSYTEAIRQNEELNLLKSQLTRTLSKLEAEEGERQRVAGDLYKAQQSLDLIQGELSKVADHPEDLIENEQMDQKEKMTAGLNQTVRELQQLLQGVSQQLSKTHQEVDKDLPKV